MLGIDLVVTYNDGRVVSVSPNPRDQVAFERQFDESISDIGNETRIEWVYFLAWHGLHRQGLEDAGFDEFLDKIAEIDVKVTKDLPTGPVPSAI